MTQPFLTCEVLAAGAPVPPDILAAVEQGGRCLVVAAGRGGRLVAYVVASVDLRAVEVFHLADPADFPPEAPPIMGRFMGRFRGRFRGTDRFRLLGGRVFHERSRGAPSEDHRPEGRTWFRETWLRREPDQIVHLIEREPGHRHEVVFDGIDLSAHYARTPPPGDWAFFVEFPGGAS